MNRRDLFKYIPFAGLFPFLKPENAISGLIDPSQPVWGRQGEWVQYNSEKENPKGLPVIQLGNSHEKRVPLPAAGTTAIFEVIGSSKQDSWKFPQITNADEIFADIPYAERQIGFYNNKPITILEREILAYIPYNKNFKYYGEVTIRNYILNDRLGWMVETTTNSKLTDTSVSAGAIVCSQFPVNGLVHQ